MAKQIKVIRGGQRGGKRLFRPNGRAIVKYHCPVCHQAKLRSSCDLNDDRWVDCKSCGYRKQVPDDISPNSLIEREIQRCNRPPNQKLLPLRMES